MQQVQLCVCGGRLKIVLSKRQLAAKCEKCGRIRAASERPRPVRRPA
jgi:hypothetical protein